MPNLDVYIPKWEFHVTNERLTELLPGYVSILLLGIALLLPTSAVMAQKPDKPSYAYGSGGDSKVRLGWADPDEEGITWEYAQKSKGGSYGDWVEMTDVWSRGPDLQYEVTGLTNGALYVFKIRGVNDSGDGKTSNSFLVTPLPASEAPIVTVASTSAKAINLSWTVPGDTHRAPDGYDINRCVEEEGSDPCTPVYHAWVNMGNTYRDTKVTANTTYRYMVVAYRGVAGSDASNPITAVAQQK